MSAFLDTITSSSMLARCDELQELHPDIRVILYMLGAHRKSEWLHSIAAVSDETIRSLLPPIPAKELRSIVAASEDEVFLWTGAVDIENLLGIFEHHVVSRRAKPRVLDFGCGCGRLTRFLNLSTHYEAMGADANPDHVAWCSSNLTNVHTIANRPLPPLDIPDASVDFIYSLSVFSHFSSEMAAAWLAELGRIMAPNALLAITTHGYPALEIIRSSEVHHMMFNLTAVQTMEIERSLPELGHVYLPYDRTTLSSANVGDDYGNAFIDVGKSTIWPETLEVIDHLPGGLRGWQDIVVLRKL